MTTILVVDDDPDFVEVMRLILENEYEVNTAANGKQALQRMRADKPDLVLLDVMMSYVLDGLEVTEAMSRDPDLQDIPIIMVSSLSSTRYADMFPTDRYVAIDDWISKPVNPDDLLARVSKALDQS